MIYSQKPRLLDQVRQVIRVKHYSLRTQESYINWIKRFILLGQKNVETTMIYTHVINQGGKGVRSPADF